MPGALFLTGAIVLYGLGTLDLIQLMAAGGLHLVIGWVYLLLSPWWLPRQADLTGAKGNPCQNSHGQSPTPIDREQASEVQRPREDRSMS